MQRELYKLSLPQLKWRRSKILNFFQTREHLFKQEYPANVDEAFNRSGARLVPTDLVRLSVNRPIFRDGGEPVVCGVDNARTNGLSAAMLDRLLHRSVVLNLDGDSYRLRDHNARAEKLRRTTTGTRQPLQ